MEDFPSFSYLIGYQYSLVTRVIFGVSILIRVCIIVVLFILFDDVLHDLVNRNIKRLNITYTTSRNYRDCYVKFFKLINKAIHFLLLLLPTLFMRLKSIKN
jgi:hypothetical protein